MVFKNILIPISSEFYSKEVFEQGAYLAERFESKVTIVYIIEEKTLSQTEKRTDTFRTRVEKEETKKVIINSQRQTADTIVFTDAQISFDSKGIFPFKKIVEGEFSTIIEHEIKASDFDLVLMSYEKECLLKYRVLNDIDIPLWVTGTPGGKTLLSICSSRTPNQKVLQMSQELAQLLAMDLSLLYIVDVEDTIAYDEHTKRFVKTSVEDLLETGQRFVDELQIKGIPAHMTTGSVEGKTVQTAKKLNAGLVVIGQEQKRYDLLGFSVKSINHRIVEKCKYPILFLK
jgi:K+-sensing histidine kinase KdpD